MSFQESIESQLTEKFNKAKLAGSHELSPRNGYFFIETVDYELIPKKGKVPIATTLWKAQSNDAFIKEVHFKIAISGLNLLDPSSYVSLSNRVIKIANAQIVKDALSGKPTMNFEYSLPDEKPVFTTLQDIVIAAFMGDETTTLSEAYKKFESDLGIDLSESIEEEARGQDITEDNGDDDNEDLLEDFPCED